MKRTKRGFTMAEMLITIGIIAVLMAFASIPIAGYMRSLHQVEMDAIAKEIFVAAQNHLTMADSQKLTARLPETEEALGKKDGSDVRYFVVGDTVDSYPGNGDKVLNYMLPVASIDDTVRLNGSYVIRYSPSQAKILDVFYASKTGRFSHTFSAGEYSALKKLDDTPTEDNTVTVDNRSARRNCLGGAAIGWYGGEAALDLERGTKLQTPTVEVINAERLLVRVSYKHAPLASVAKDDPIPPDAMINLTLTVKGEQSKNCKVFHLITNGGKTDDTDGVKSVDTNTFEIVLDDVTSPRLHFADVCQTDALIPGENIIVQAELNNNSVLTNVAESSAVKTNSLFADLKEIKGKPTAVISNIRHLENLNTAVSALDKAALGSLQHAMQTAELDWNQFMAAILGVPARNSGDYDAVYGTEEQPVNYGTEQKKGVRICTYAASSQKAKEPPTNCFMPVDMENMIYNDEEAGAKASHTIANIKTDVTNGPAGVFGTLKNCSLSWVTVYNNVGENEDKLAIKGSGAAGGLVGVMMREVKTGETEENVIPSVISFCGAAVYVESTGTGDADTAGGLIGTATNTIVSNSYSGGHTKDGKYLAQDTGEAHWNVKGVTAGGLIGTVNGGSVGYSYSTTSVYGTAKAGGLVGDIQGRTSVSGNYATGLVKADAERKAGSFAGALSDTAVLGTGNDLNYYYEAVNYDGSKNEGLAAVPGKETGEDIGRIDKDLNSLNKFYPVAGEQSLAIVYDKPFLENRYNERYPLLDVTGIGTHYGDWPMMETFVINK